MTNRIRVTTETLKQGGGQLAELSVEFDKLGRDLLQSLASTNDYGGQLPNKKTGLQGQYDARAIREQLKGMDEQLRRLAAQFEETDQGSQNFFQGLGAWLKDGWGWVVSFLGITPATTPSPTITLTPSFPPTTEPTIESNQETTFPDPDSPVPLSEQFAKFVKNRKSYTEPDGPYPIPGSIQEFLAELAGYPVPISNIITPQEAAIMNELAPWDLLKGFNIVNEAFDTETKYYGTSANNDGVPDAFRHNYWAARLTQAFGADWARRFTDAHECKIGNQAARDFMDRWNNALGIQIAMDNPSASPDELANLVAQAINDGKGVYIPGGGVENGPLAYTNQDLNTQPAPILPVDDTGSGIR